MTMVTRRSVLGGLAALLAQRSPGAEPPARPDVVIVGAGAAGIAAGRALAAAGLRVQILEARNRIGGRVLTDTDSLGVSWERGCARLPRAADRDLGVLAGGLKQPLRMEAPALRLYAAGRPQAAADVAVLLSLRARAAREIAAAAVRGADISALAALSRAVREDPRFPRVAADFRLQHGTGLEQLSVLDAAGTEAGDQALVAPRGLSGLFDALAQKLAVRLSTPVRRIRLGGPRARIETANGTLEAGVVVVTVPAAVIAGGGLTFDPALPESVLQACHDLPAGVVDKVALRFRRTPLEELAGYLVPADEAASAPLRILVPPDSGNFCVAEIGGAAAVELEAAGEQAQIDFALAALKDLLGSGVARDFDKGAATRWLVDPWSRGSHSHAVPGRFRTRDVLARPVQAQLLFAGEHTATVGAGSVHGAWLSGLRAAREALRLLGRPIPA